MIANKVLDDYNEVSIDMLIDEITYKPNPTCKFGDWHINTDSKVFYLCVAGNRVNRFESIDMNGIYCRQTCAVPG